jgi:hypothetical protein
MIKLNLLPEEYKKEYNLEKTRRFIMFVSVSLYFISFIFILLIFFGYFYLKFETKSIISKIDSEKTTQQIKDVFSLEDNIKLVNKKISIIEKAKLESTNISKILEEVSYFDGSDSYLKNINVESQSGQVSISGFALNRDAVLLVKEAIKNSDMVDKDSILSPKTNILKEEKIDFNFIFKLKKQ